MVLKDNLFSIISEEGLKSRIQLNVEHPIYQAHFPGNPITPGVCLVQIIGELAGCRVGHSLALSNVVNLKFLAPISPINTPVIDIEFTSIDKEGNDTKTKGTIMAGDKAMTKFSIVYSKK